jgi:hypothetical protein
MSDGLPVDAIALREEVKTKYRAVAVNPHGSFHFIPDARWRTAWAKGPPSSLVQHGALAPS